MAVWAISQVQKRPAAINLQNLKLRLAATPRETSIDFYNRLGKGGETVPLPNGKGTMIKLPKGCAGMQEVNTAMRTWIMILSL